PRRLLSCYFYSSSAPPDLHSFPTRRSSDLLIPTLFAFLPPPPDSGFYGDLGFFGAERDCVSRKPRARIPRGDLQPLEPRQIRARDRKSTRLNSSHVAISYAVFCLKKKKPTM